MCSFQVSFGSSQTPSTRMALSRTTTWWSATRTVDARSSRACPRRLVKCIIWYLSGANFAPCLQRIISVFGLSTYLDTPLVFHAPLWSTLLQFRPRQTVPAQVILCLLLKHTSPGLCCLGDTTSPSPRPVTGLSDRLLSVAKDQVLSTSKVVSSCLFVHRHARLSSRAMQIVS